MSIVITGTPGVGKHTIGKEISQKLRLEIIDIQLMDLLQQKKKTQTLKPMKSMMKQTN